MVNRKRNPYLHPFRSLIVSGIIIALTFLLSSQVFASAANSDISITITPLDQEGLLLAQQMGPPEGRGPRHRGRGIHCPDRDFEQGCTGRHGMGHRSGGRGMHRGGGMGRHHAGGQSGSAICPQPRSTVKAPDQFYNLVNPLEKTSSNIEKGRVLFSGDVQPACTMCHGVNGDGTGGFGSDMSPKPRNFTCSEMMQVIPDGQFFWVIQNGSPDTGMPPFKDLKDEQIWQLVIYIRSLIQ